MPLHSPLSWQILELLPDPDPDPNPDPDPELFELILELSSSSRYPKLQEYVAVEARMLPDCTTRPFDGSVKLAQFTAEKEKLHIE